MRIGAGLDTAGTVDKIVSRAKRLAATGVKSMWSSQIFGHDALSVFTVVGREVKDVEFGTAVIPIHPRHPMVLANQALTVQDACGGRFVLGIGLSHQMVVEGIWGLSFDRPVRYMREYLSILVPLLEGEQVSFTGELIRTSTIGPLENATGDPPPVIVAALGSAMLKLGRRDGRRDDHLDDGSRHDREACRSYDHGVRGESGQTSTPCRGVPSGVRYG